MFFLLVFCPQVCINSKDINSRIHLGVQLVVLSREALQRLVEGVVAHAGGLVVVESLLLLLLPLSAKRVVCVLQVEIILAKLVPLSIVDTIG